MIAMLKDFNPLQDIHLQAQSFQIPRTKASSPENSNLRSWIHLVTRIRILNDREILHIIKTTNIWILQ